MTLDREGLAENGLEEARRVALEIARLRKETDEAAASGVGDDGEGHSVGRTVGYVAGVVALLVWIW